MVPPFIGLTTYGRSEDKRFYLPVQYIDAVRTAGGIPLLLPPGESHSNALMAHLDGLILTGGGDLDPVLYGGSVDPTLYMVDPERDRTELALVRLSLDLGLPTFGICRGTQVINIALGGTLIEHLPEGVGESVRHRLPPREPIEHLIKLRPDSRLARILLQDNFLAPSCHHQSVRQLGPGLKAVAHAPDETIEAIELPDHPWLVGVQWHPELTAEDFPLHQKLFDELIKAASERQRKRFP